MLSSTVWHDLFEFHSNKYFHFFLACVSVYAEKTFVYIRKDHIVLIMWLIIDSALSFYFTHLKFFIIWSLKSFLS